MICQEHNVRLYHSARLQAGFCPECAIDERNDEITRVDILELLLKAIRGWDMLDGCADGPYWKAKIDKVLDGSLGVDGDTPIGPRGPAVNQRTVGAGVGSEPTESHQA